MTPSDADLNALALAVWNAYVTNLGPQISTGVAIEGCNLIYYGGGGLQIGGQHVQTTNGAKAGTPLPAQVSTCISWHVQQRYRGGHPRTYLPGMVSESMNTTAIWQTTYTEAVRVAANQFHVAVNAATAGALTDLHLGTVSFVLGGAWRSPPVFRDYTPAAALVDARIDTQRRRLGPDV